MAEIAGILDRAASGRRLLPEEALTLLESAELAELGEAADAVTNRKHPEPTRTYLIDRNINYTNVCITDCSFCAFYRRPGAEDAYVRTRDELSVKIRETLALGGTQILLQGGHHPHLKIDWYEDLLRWIHGNFPIHVHGFSPPEVHHVSRVSKLTIRETLRRLIAAGLNSLPGGGAEILVDRVRGVISPKKTTSAEWLEVMETAHGLGILGSATMMYGHAETLAERVEHLRLIRDLQDRTEGFIAFISWTYQPDRAPRGGTKLGAHEYLRTQAVSRLFLDNFDNIQSSWVTQGPKIGQVALRFGANDMGSVMIEENVVSAAGTTYGMDEPQIRHLIETAGYKAMQRDFFYRPVQRAPARPATV